MATTEKGIYYPYDYTKTADVLADMKTMAESVDAAIEKSKYNDKDIKDEVKNIQNEQKTQNKSIEANTTKNTEQDKLIQKLQSNMINESTEEATSLYVEDASDLPAVLSVRGNHYQETQEGTSNLAVLTEGTIEQNGNKVVVENGVATLSGTNSSDTTNYVKVGTAYLYEGKKYYINNIRSLTAGSHGALLRGSTTKWFTANTEVEWECPKTGEWDIEITYSAGQYATGTEKFLISETSGAEWVQGKRTIPSLEYPSSIETVTGTQKIIRLGNNIFDNQMEKGDITAYSGVNASSTTRIRSKNYISLFNMKKIRIIRDDSNSTTTIGLRFYDKDKNFLGYSTTALTGLVDLTSILSNILEKGAKYFRFVVVDETDLTKKYGINLDNSTEFIEHEQKEYNLSVQQEMLQNDYFDLTNIKEVHNYEKKNMSELAWQVSANTLQEKTFDFVVMFSNEELLSTEINCFSNSFKSETASYLNSNDEEGIGQSKSQIICRIGKEKVADLNAFKTLLAEKNAVVYVKTRSELDLTEEQKEVLQQLNNLDLYKGTNNIYTDQDLALLQLDYTVDTKMYIDNKIANLKEQVNTTNELLSTTGTSAMLLDNLQNDLESEVM